MFTNRVFSPFLIKLKEVLRIREKNNVKVIVSCTALFILLIALAAIVYQKSLNEPWGPPSEYQLSIGHIMHDEKLQMVDRNDKFSDPKDLKALLVYPAIDKTVNGKFYVENNKNLILKERTLQIKPGDGGEIMELDSDDWENGKYKAILMINGNEIINKTFEITKPTE